MNLSVTSLTISYSLNKISFPNFLQSKYHRQSFRKINLRRIFTPIFYATEDQSNLQVNQSQIILVSSPVIETISKSIYDQKMPNKSLKITSNLEIIRCRFESAIILDEYSIINVPDYSNLCINISECSFTVITSVYNPPVISGRVDQFQFTKCCCANIKGFSDATSLKLYANVITVNHTLVDAVGPRVNPGDYPNMIFTSPLSMFCHNNNTRSYCRVDGGIARFRDLRDLKYSYNTAANLSALSFLAFSFSNPSTHLISDCIMSRCVPFLNNVGAFIETNGRIEVLRWVFLHSKMLFLVSTDDKTFNIGDSSARFVDCFTDVPDRAIERRTNVEVVNLTRGEMEPPVSYSPSFVFCGLTGVRRFMPTPSDAPLAVSTAPPRTRAPLSVDIPPPLSEAADPEVRNPPRRPPKLKPADVVQLVILGVIIALSSALFFRASYVKRRRLEEENMVLLADGNSVLE